MAGRRAKRLVKVGIQGLLAVVIAEAVLQAWALLHPAYDVLFLQPDRKLGWKQVPDLRWTWAGTQWFAAEFSVPVQTNSHGFRDLERAWSKPDGLVRIALLGDSLIEAVQVPLERTAGQLLERRLEASAGLAGGERFEVLNLGISNYGVGQLLLVWEEYARRFAPDTVFALVSDLHFRRTVARYETGGFPSTRRERLWVRPTFRLEGGSLVRKPARDYGAFVTLQAEVIEREFGGRRMRRRMQSAVRAALEPVLGRLWGVAAPDALEELPPLDSEVLAINLEVLRELGRQVHGADAQLVLLDASSYLNPLLRALPPVIQALSIREDFGYVPLGDALLRAERSGVAPRWRHDFHFNPAGNEILAAAMYDWMAQRLEQPEGRGPPQRGPSVAPGPKVDDEDRPAG